MLLPREVKGIEVEFVARYVNCVDVWYVGTLYTEVCTRFPLREQVHVQNGFNSTFAVNYFFRQSAWPKIHKLQPFETKIIIVPPLRPAFVNNSVSNAGRVSVL